MVWDEAISLFKDERRDTKETNDPTMKQRFYANNAGIY